ncbi:hypothetical protein HDU99_008409 [Rhizoclosmatium hyalinum]|nr:hypothetical protein HDU99_008409 [Rhizoclosmatium hyalinum]
MHCKYHPGEKLGGAQKTETSEEFKNLEHATEQRKAEYEKLDLQLNSFVKSISRGEGKDKDRSPMEAFGSAMSTVGNTLEASAYTKALILVGDAHTDVATSQRTFVNIVKDGYLEEMNRQMADVKDYQRLKTKLENRRLDYDAKMNKVQKAKAANPALEEDVRVAQSKYEETLQDITARMISLNANEEDQLTELCRLVDAEVEFFQAGLERLMQVQKEFANIPRVRSGNNRAEYKRSISAASSLYDTHRDSTSHTPAFTPPLGSNASVGRLTRSNSGFNSGGGPPPLPNRDPTPSRSNSKQTRALYQFDAEGPGEMSIRKGDLINVIEEVDEGWWIGEMADGSGQRGMFPANYCEVVEAPAAPLPPYRPPSTYNAGVDASPRLAAGNVNASGGGRGYPAPVPSRASYIPSAPVPSRPQYEDPRSSSAGGAAGGTCYCGCAEFVENAFKPGQCRSCFHNKLSIFC